jgi:hypothetical protein
LLGLIGDWHADAGLPALEEAYRRLAESCHFPMHYGRDGHSSTTDKKANWTWFNLTNYSNVAFPLKASAVPHSTFRFLKGYDYGEYQYFKEYYGSLRKAIEAFAHAHARNALSGPLTRRANRRTKKDTSDG